MGIVYVDCPRCGGPLDRTERIIEGAVVVRCQRCQRYAIDSDTQWYTGESDEVIKLLQARWEAFQRETPAEREKAMLESSIHDPRWERWFPP